MDETSNIEDILKKDLEEIKKYAKNSDLDLKKLLEMERQGEKRDHIIEWLEKKIERLEMTNDNERIKELLSHLEHAYRIAAIPKETYEKAKKANKKLLEDE